MCCECVANVLRMCCECVASVLRMCCECVANVLLVCCECVANVVRMRCECVAHLILMCCQCVANDRYYQPATPPYKSRPKRVILPLKVCVYTYTHTHLHTHTHTHTHTAGSGQYSVRRASVLCHRARSSNRLASGERARELTTGGLTFFFLVSSIKFPRYSLNSL